MNCPLLLSHFTAQNTLLHKQSVSGLCAPALTHPAKLRLIVRVKWFVSYDLLISVRYLQRNAAGVYNMHYVVNRRQVTLHKFLIHTAISLRTEGRSQRGQKKGH